MKMQSPPDILRKGDRVVIEYGESQCTALVTLASGNGVSLVLEFEAIVFGHVGFMPVMYEHGEYRALISGDRFTIRRQS